MENVNEFDFEKDHQATATTPQSLIILEALELLNEVKRYRGMFYKQKVAKLEAKAKKLNLN
jgi:hypothetical protein